VPDRPGDMDESDVDARFASIVAQWEGPVPDADHEGDDPASEKSPDAVAPAGAPVTDEAGTTPTVDVPDTGEEPDQATTAAPPTVPPPPWVNPSPLDVVVPSSAWRVTEPTDAATDQAAAEAEAALDAELAREEPHFEPPEVVLPPQEDLSFWGAVIGLVAGPLMLLYVVFARPFHSTRWFIAAVVISLLGFALLVLRQPTHRDPTSGDDGARV
jgi:hypothetical protein